MIAGLLTTKPQVEAGTLRGLAVSGLTRATKRCNGTGSWRRQVARAAGIEPQ